MEKEDIKEEKVVLEQSEQIKTTLKEVSPPKGMKGKKKGKRVVGEAKVYIYSTFNNTILTITTKEGDTLSWTSAGSSGFKGTRKGTAFAAQVAAQNTTKKALDLGVKQVSVFVRGPGPGRETAIRTLQAGGLEITSIRDITPIPHNGCRPPKERRV